MAILTTIAGVPLFTTIQEALDWAAANNLSGYHIHNYQGQQGYMGGANHLEATGMPINSNAPTTNQSTSSSSSGSGGGGY